MSRQTNIEPKESPFNVRFVGEEDTGKGGGAYTWQARPSVCFHNINVSPQGFKLLRTIKDQFNRSFNYKEINLVSVGAYEDVVINIPEDKAADMKMFEENFIIDVKVPSLYLNQFCHQMWIYDDKTEDLEEDPKPYKYITKIDKEAIMKAWADAGYPLRWGFKAVEESPEEGNFSYLKSLCRYIK